MREGREKDEVLTSEPRVPRGSEAANGGRLSTLRSGVLTRKNTENVRERRPG